MDALRAPLGSTASAETGCTPTPSCSACSPDCGLRCGFPPKSGTGYRPRSRSGWRHRPRHLERTIGRFTEDIDRAAGTVTDSPAFVDGDFVATGGFHEVELSAGLDALALALIRTAELAGQRIIVCSIAVSAGCRTSSRLSPVPRAA